LVSLIPGFYTMGMALAVEATVGFLHGRGDPSPGLSWPKGVFTTSDNLSKGTVLGETQAGPALRLGQATREVQAGKLQNTSLGRAKPWQRDPIDRPGEYALGVGLEKGFGGQIVAKGEDSLRRNRGFRVVWVRKVHERHIVLLRKYDTSGQ